MWTERMRHLGVVAQQQWSNLTVARSCLTALAPCAPVTPVMHSEKSLRSVCKNLPDRL